MKKRLRKKLRLREFQALGFGVTGTLAESVDDARLDRLLDEIIEFVESRGLVCGGGLSPRERSLSFFVERSPRTCTEEDRDAAGAWFRARPEVASVDVHPLSDAWYPDGPRRRS